MKLASFVVKPKGSSVGYCANHLTIGRRNVEGGSVSTLSFICSGVMTTFDAAQIESIEFNPTGAQHCSECDGPMSHFVGAGIHVDPGVDSA